MADPVELEGWTDSASGFGGAFGRMVDGEIAEIFAKPETVVELSPGRSSDEAILDLHENWSMMRVVLRNTGEVGSILFTSIKVLATAKRKLEEQVAEENRARKHAEAECARLAEQLKLAQAREFGTSSEQKLLASNTSSEADSSPASRAELESKKKLRLAASGGGRKPLADHLPREEVPHKLDPHECKCTECNSELIELAPTVTEEMYTIPKQHVVRRHVQANYHCPCCKRFTSVNRPGN